MSDKKIDNRFNHIKDDIKSKVNKPKQTDKQNNRDDVVNDVEGDVNVNGTVTITSKKNKGKVKRTYYLDPEVEKNITWLSRKTDRDKSEIVSLALEYFFDNVEVE